MENKTKVEGGALAEIFKLLFKGVDNLLGSAAEYQNDMGILKQVNTIPIIKKDKEYTIQVKLAPVKDREGLFYVEIDDGGSGLDFSKYDKKPVQLDTKNKEGFEKYIQQVIKDAGATILNTDDSGKKGKKEVIECYDVDDYMKWEENGQQGQEPDIIDVIKYESPSEESGKVNITLQCTARELKPSDERLLDDVLTDVPTNEVNNVILDILKTSKLITVESAKEEEEDVDQSAQETEMGTPASSHVDVSLSYIKSSDEVNLNAIYANYDVNEAMNALQQVIDNDEFIASLTEEPQSFRITDEGDDYDVTVIDDVDTSCAASDIYTSICALSGLLDAYSVNLDPQKQAAAQTLMNALTQAQDAFCPDIKS